jgi:hypothetical protein
MVLRHSAAVSSCPWRLRAITFKRYDLVIAGAQDVHRSPWGARKFLKQVRHGTPLRGPHGAHGMAETRYMALCMYVDFLHIGHYPHGRDNSRIYTWELDTKPAGVRRCML